MYFVIDDTKNWLLVSVFQLLVVKYKKTYVLEIDNTNTGTAYNWQFPYLNFKWQNDKKQAFCDGKPKNGNCLQL